MHVARIAKRVVGLLAVVLAVNAVTFLAMAVLGGGSTQVSTMHGGSIEAIRLGESTRARFLGPDERLRARYGNADRYLRSYRAYLAGAARGELGQMPGTNPEPIAELIRRALPRSLALLALSLTVAAAGGVAIAFASVSRHTRRTNPMALGVSLVGFSMPAFYVGIVLSRILVHSNQWLGRAGESTLLPTSGTGYDSHLVLPVIALAARPLAEVARLTSDLLAAELRKPYIRAAEAKGLKWRMVLFGHAAPNVAATSIVALGSSARYLVSSLIVVEVLFAYSGIGRALASAIAPRTDGRAPGDVLYDPAIAAGLMTSLALLFVVVNLVAQESARRVDPRLRRAPA